MNFVQMYSRQIMMVEYSGMICEELTLVPFKLFYKCIAVQDEDYD
jgi:hypothetical protein